MRKWAVSIAAIGFFGLAIVGWASDVPPLYCGLRAVLGALALYVGTKLAIRLALVILVNPSLRKVQDGGQAGDTTP